MSRKRRNKEHSWNLRRLAEQGTNPANQPSNVSFERIVKTKAGDIVFRRYGDEQ